MAAGGAVAWCSTVGAAHAEGAWACGPWQLPRASALFGSESTPVALQLAF